MPDLPQPKDPKTAAALYGLLMGHFPGFSEYLPGQAVTLAGIPGQGLTTDAPDARAQAFLKAMGAVSPGPTLTAATRRMARRQSPYRFVGSAADKEGSLTGIDLPNISMTPPTAGRPGNF